MANGEIAIRAIGLSISRTSRSSKSQAIPTRPTTSGVTVTGSSTQGITTVPHPVYPRSGPRRRRDTEHRLTRDIDGCPTAS
jgi:hypothetical protein